MNLPEHFMVGNSAVNTSLIADDRPILSKSESVLHMAIHLVEWICEDFGLKTPTLKAKLMAFHDDDPTLANMLYMVLFWRR